MALELNNVTEEIIGSVTTLDLSAANAGLSTGIADVVDDTTPQLGGELDVNGNTITGTDHVTEPGISARKTSGPPTGAVVPPVFSATIKILSVTESPVAGSRQVTRSSYVTVSPGAIASVKIVVGVASVVDSAEMI